MFIIHCSLIKEVPCLLYKWTANGLYMTNRASNAMREKVEYSILIKVRVALSSCRTGFLLILRGKSDTQRIFSCFQENENLNAFILPIKEETCMFLINWSWKIREMSYGKQNVRYIFKKFFFCWACIQCKSLCNTQNLKKLKLGLGLNFGPG